MLPGGSRRCCSPRRPRAARIGAPGPRQTPACRAHSRTRSHLCSSPRPRSGRRPPATGQRLCAAGCPLQQSSMTQGSSSCEQKDGMQKGEEGRGNNEMNTIGGHIAIHADNSAKRLSPRGTCLGCYSHLDLRSSIRNFLEAC